MKYVYRFDCLIGESQVANMEKVLNKTKLNTKYNFVFDIKSEDGVSENTISVEFHYNLNRILNITVKKVYNDEIIFTITSVVEDIYKLLSVYILDFEIGKVSYKLLLNFDKKEPAGIDGDIEKNINRLNNFEGKIKGKHFKELFNEICYLNCNSILDIIYISYTLCCIEDEAQALFLKKKFSMKLKEVGIDFKEILNDIKRNPNEFKEKLDNLETLNVSDLCYALLGVVFVSDEYKPINSKKRAISKDRYYSAIEKLIRTNKGIELL